MRIPFSLYDFLGYAVPGLIVIIILAILIDPALLSNFPNELEDKESRLAHFLRPTVMQGILYMIVCYLVGFATHGLIYWLFGQLATIFAPLKRYHSDYGSFEKGLFDPGYRDDSEDFGPYTNEFVKNLKTAIENVFSIKVETVQEEAKNAGNDVKYTEIFDLCRTTVLKQSPDLYSRGFALLARYNSAKLMGSIFFLAAVGFLVRIFVSSQLLQWTPILIFVWIFVLLLILVNYLATWLKKKKRKRKTDNCNPEKSGWRIWFSNLFLWYWFLAGMFGVIALWQKEVSVLFICYCVSAVLCPIFFGLYHILFKYYRNTIIYGFYEYAVVRERLGEPGNSEN